MKLYNKVFLFTTLTTFVVGAFIIAYFVWMLPGLYVDYKLNYYVEQVSNLHDAYTSGEKNIAEDDSGNDFIYSIFQIPAKGYAMNFNASWGKGTLEINNEVLQKALNDVRELMKNEKFTQADVGKVFSEERMKRLGEEIAGNEESAAVAVRNFKPASMFTDANASHTLSVKETPAGNYIGVYTVSTNENKYTNLVTFSSVDDSFYFSIASVVTPALFELSPIILQSLPMIIVFLLLFALLTGYFFAKILAEPIATIAKRAMLMQNVENEVICEPIFKQTEYQVLENALNQLYVNLRKALKNERKQKEELIEQQKRQELFIMNSSHQLKTPVTACMLLTDGMLHNVGKYKDHATYLPQLQQELRHMQDIIYNMLEILQLKQSSIAVQTIDVSALVQASITLNESLLKAKGLKVEYNPEAVWLVSNERTLHALLDNLIMNAIQHTENNKQIKIEVTQKHFRIQNYGAKIEEELLPHLFEPFAKGKNSANKNSGLGLYIAAACANALGYVLQAENKAGYVELTCVFKQNEEGKEC